MVLRKLTNKDIPAAKDLWMEAFGDSEEFVRYYFANKIKLKNTMGAFIKGELVGDITMQEMVVHMRGADLPTGFLAGCATRQSFRNQHIMQQLLFAQMRVMDRQGYAVCHLHPFAHAFYRKYGWETVSFMSREIKKPQKDKRNPNDAKDNLTDFDRIYGLYIMFCNRADGYFKRTQQDMAIRLREHAIDGGDFMATQGAYALFFEEQGQIDVIEFVWLGQQDKEELLLRLAELGTVQYCSPDYLDGNKKPEEYTMMRVVNVVRLLEKLVLADCSFTIAVQDEFLPWNNVRLACEYRNGCAKTQLYSGLVPDIHADVRDLALLAAGKTLEKHNAACEILTKQNTVFFNTY